LALKSELWKTSCTLLYAISAQEFGTEKPIFSQSQPFVMGNYGSSASETDGVKAQAEGSVNPIYNLLDLKGLIFLFNRHTH
jgi:hypothetical protein